MQCSYITSAQKAEQLPAFDISEIAFVGRSNSGKSTLLNALMGSKLARTSATPGRTQMVNFFSYGENLIFADLPGYGYSKISAEVRRHWQRLVEAYLGRPNVQGFLFLMDGRRDLDDEDQAILREIARRKTTYVILTKTDKLNRAETLKRQGEIHKQLGKARLAVSGIFPVSSLKKTGVEELKELILKLIQ